MCISENILQKICQDSNETDISVTFYDNMQRC